MHDDLPQAVFAAAERDDVAAAVAAVYAAVGEAIDLRKPICRTSGKCCRFEEYGHRLYVTTLELAAFVRGTRVWPVNLPGRPQEALGRDSGVTSGDERAQFSLPVVNVRPTATSWNGQGCPYQIDGLCGVHDIRPFGCRIFYCDATSTRWQQDQYELFHAELRRLHESLDVPYHYVEWRFAVQELGLAGREA